MKSIFASLSDQQIVESISDSRSFSETIMRLGMRNTQREHYQLLRDFVNSHAISIAHFVPDPKKIGRRALPLETLLVKGVAMTSTSTFKSRLIKAGFLVEKCAGCGLGSEWNGAPLVLQLDHEDGDRSNNLLENLRLMCPNCHSQTDTYAGKNSTIEKISTRKDSKCVDCGCIIDRYSTRCVSCAYGFGAVSQQVSVEEISSLVWEITAEQIAEKIGFSESAVRRFIKRNSIETPPPGFWHLKNLGLGDDEIVDRLKAGTTPRVGRRGGLYVHPTKIVWPSNQDLERMVWEESLRKLGAKLGVSDNSVNKRCKKLGIQLPPVGYWRCRELGMSHDQSIEKLNKKEVDQR